MNPLWVDARDYLTSQGQQITTGGLNQAMNLLASNPQLRPSAVKAGGGAAGIAAGLGAPTDQIIQTPLAPPASQGITETPLPPPVSPSPASGGKHGASSGKRTAGGTSASGKTVKDIPAGVGSAKTPMGGYTPPTPPAQTPMGGYTPPAPPSQPGSPVGTAQAGTGAEDPGFLSHLMSGDYNDRLGALGTAGLGLVGALLMHRASGAKAAASAADAMAGAHPWGTPDVMANHADMPMAPYGTPNAFPDPLAGAAPYGTPGAFEPPPDPLAGAAPWGTPSAMGDNAPNQSPTPYSGEAPQTMPPQLEGLIDELIKGSPVTNPIGTRRGTQTPYSGAVPPGVTSGIPDPIMQLLGRAGADASGPGRTYGGPVYGPGDYGASNGRSR